MQSSNVEAVTELANLAPAKRKQGSNCSSSSAAMSSSKWSKHGKSPSFPTNYDEPLPFSRTYQDNFKLKISILPLTIDVPTELPPPFIGADEKVKRPAASLLTNVPTRLETFSYPSWERYVIQKMT